MDWFETCETSQAAAPAGPPPVLQVRLWHRARGQPHQDSPGDRDHVARPDLGTGEKRRVVQFCSSFSYFFWLSILRKLGFMVEVDQEKTGVEINKTWEFSKGKLSDQNSVHFDFMQSTALM